MKTARKEMALLYHILDEMVQDLLMAQSCSTPNENVKQTIKLLEHYLDMYSNGMKIIERSAE